MLCSRGSLSFSIQVLSNTVTMLLSSALLSQGFWVCSYSEEGRASQTGPSCWRPEAELRGTGKGTTQRSTQGPRCCWAPRGTWHQGQPAVLPCLAAPSELPATATETNFSSLAVRQQKGPEHVLCQGSAEEVDAVSSKEVKAVPYHLQRVSYNLIMQLSLTDKYPPGMMS